MEIVARSSIESSGNRIEISHNGQHCGFYFSTFKKEQLDKNDVFRVWNNFWKASTKPFQQAVYDIYSKMSDAFFSVNDRDMLERELNKLVIELYKYHPWEKIRDFVQHKSGILIPPDIPEDYVLDRDKDYTVEKTYNRADYIDMVTHALMCQLMVPVWAYFIRVIKDHSGTGLKENKAYKLLAGTDLFGSPAEKKMVAYVAANTKVKMEKSGAMGLLHPDEHPYLAMSKFCVSKLSIAELQPREPRATLVSLLFSHVGVTGAAGNFQDRYKEKPSSGSDDSNSEGSDSMSTLERHRNSTDLSIEEACEYEVNLWRGPAHTASMLCPNLPKDALKKTMATSKELLLAENAMLTGLPCQKTILGWVLSPHLSCKAIPYQEHKTIVQHLALCEALLWHKGFKYLALLCTSRIPLDNSLHLVTNTPLRSRMSEENILKIRSMFPHVRVTHNRKLDQKEECFCMAAIDLLINDINSYTWVTTADIARVSEFNNSESRRLVMTPDIRNEVARLIIAINTKELYS